jgi:AraC-like DNA-binding protein
MMAMPVAPHLLQPSIPPAPADPARPFPEFGWPALLCGPVQDYHYPEHLGPVSVNFCFGGVLSFRTARGEQCADSTLFCVASRRQPTEVRTLSPRRAHQVAFFYTDLPEAEAWAAADGLHALDGPVAALVRQVRAHVTHGTADDALMEELHATLPALLRPEPAPESAADHRLEAARRAIDLDPVTPRTLEDRAREVGLSKYHFLRAFKQRFHRPPSQYALARKMERARWMLAAREHRVEEVCRLLGYASWSNFALQFRQASGVTPKEYQLLPFTAAQRAEARARLPHLP